MHLKLFKKKSDPWKYWPLAESFDGGFFRDLLADCLVRWTSRDDRLVYDSNLAFWLVLLFFGLYVFRPLLMIFLRVCSRFSVCFVICLAFLQVLWRFICLFDGS